jgi:FkbM family methyltransferase
MNDPSASRKLPIRRKITGVFSYITGPWSARGALEKRLALVDAQLALVEAQLRRLELSHTVYLGDHEALTRLHTGHRVYVDTRDASIASHLMLEGRWEPWVENILVPAIKPGMRFVDIGANFGYFTLLGAEMVGVSGHVYSFEANPLIFQKLVKSVSVNGFSERISLFNVAVHDESSPMEILFRHDASGGGCTDIAKGARPALGEVFPVQGEPLDTLLADIPKVDVIKIDVEGAEPKVLAGAKNLIARSRNLTIILEFDTRRSMMQTPQEYLQDFEAQGFSIAIAEPQGLTQKLSPAECVARLNGSVNYLMLSR